MDGVKLFGLLLAISEVLIISGISQPAYAAGLQVTYGSSGIQQLSYNGVTLEDLSRDASDAFHIWHMSSSSLNGGALTRASMAGESLTTGGLERRHPHLDLFIYLGLNQCSIRAVGRYAQHERRREEQRELRNYF